MNGTPLKIGPRSAAWLRQVGLRTHEDLSAVGAVDAFVRVRRAGFKPSISLLYTLEGALTGQHWQRIPEARRLELRVELENAIAGLPPTPNQAISQPGPVTWSQPGAPIEQSRASDGDAPEND
ncbi:MAG: TfoX/Sxy family protein [Xanthomonadaceae bacterium]|jgi:hypothetical protein|nr:TfoX/Sxy family protein [Xanthomonadaceae bacterium]